MSRRLYLAYGSNLSREQMRARCPSAIPLDAVVIPGWRLAFVGDLSPNWGEGAVATIVPSPEHCALAMVYAIQPDDESSLDNYEGVRRGFYTKEEAFATYKGDPLYTYICSKGSEGYPGSAYLGVLRQGFQDWKLHIDPLNPVVLAVK